MKTQKEKGELFQALHQRSGCFVIPNPWDVGSAKLLSGLGFDALATTSAGLAFSMGKSDGSNLISKEQALANASDIVLATELPVSADLENGYHDNPEGVFDTITDVGKIGLVGGSIEDATGDPGNPVYDFDLAVERIKAAAEATKRIPCPFVLTARAENFLYGRPDLKDTIRRLQAFQDAGADVLYAPGLKDIDDIATVVREVDKPVNVLMGLAGVRLTVGELADIGVKRISLGSSFSRAALGALLGAAKEVLDKGSFTFSDDAVTYAELNEWFSQKR